MNIEQTMENELKKKIKHFFQTLRIYKAKVEKTKSIVCTCPKPENVAKTNKFGWNYEAT